MSQDQFSKTEARLSSLRGQLAVGRITQEQFDTALKQLMIQDTQGRSWKIDVDSEWRVFDGQAWVEATPTLDEVDRMPAPPRSETERTPVPAYANDVRTPPPEMYQPPRRNWLPIYMLICGSLVFVLAFIFGIFLFAPPQVAVSPTPDVSHLVRDLVAFIDPNKPETLYVPEKLIQMGRAAAPALLDMIDSPKFTTRWAAIYYFSRMAQPSDIPILSKGLNDPNFSNRTTVAATLLNLGDNRGLGILYEAAQSKEPDAFSEPPQLLSTYARRVLSQIGPKNLTNNPSILPQQPGSNGLAIPRSIPNLDCAVGLGGCAVNVTLNLQFKGAGAREDLATLWAIEIKRMWDNTSSYNCCKLHLTVNTLVGGDERADYAQITVLHIPPGGRHRANATMGNSTFSNVLAGEWDDTDTSGLVAAHEAGHLMGVPDDYKDDENGFSQPVGDAVIEAAAGVPDVMAQGSLNDDGSSPKSKTRHANAILSAYGLQCPNTCVSQCPSSSSSPTKTPTPTNTPTNTPTFTPRPTNTPDLGWIEPYVQAIENQLLAQRPNDAIAIAIVTDDLRQCLIAAVRGGLSQSNAIAHCAAVIKNIPTPTATLQATPTLTPIPPNRPQTQPGQGGQQPPSGPVPGG
jgi:hypothetical protein